MTYDFCTLTDKNFVYKCLALFDSIERHMPGSRLWVLCLDDESERLFKKLGKPGIKTVALVDIGNKDLEATRARTKQEFAWTCKPAIMSYLLERKVRGSLIFADSDLLFYSSVAPLFDAHPNASIMLTSHKFTPKKAPLADLVGYFNSGFIVFKDDETSKAALRKWKGQCIEWCFNYHDKGRHGDQSYLKTWPQEFSNIEEIPEKGVNLGTWNIDRYTIRQRGEGFSIDGEALVCYHFHGFIAYLDGNTVRPYPITVHHGKIYDAYIAALQKAQDEIASVEPSWKYGFAAEISPLRWIKQETTRIVRSICQ
ncbi:MAG TPA: putative nucleotide-diphospho-sugar transferase [Candidatus Paceibacterota bacterium]|nr:putative nucleotide-diphospho-sugar transferase [Candidatus Paceibacterota bacterium]